MSSYEKVMRPLSKAGGTVSNCEEVEAVEVEEAEGKEEVGFVGEQKEEVGGC
jgi:hypothetical protein